MRKIVLTAAGISLFVSLGAQVSRATEVPVTEPPKAEQQTGGRIEIYTSPLPSIDAGQNPTSTQELIQAQQNQWGIQQGLWQQEQLRHHQQLDLKLQHQNLQQLHDIQQQQDFILRGHQ
jgi:hypothetical protein